MAANPSSSPLPPPVIPAELEHRSHRTLWIVLAAGAAIVIGAIALLGSSGVFENRCATREPGADLADCGLANKNLKRENLKNADLSGANLAHANAAGANLAGANLSRAQVAGANFAGADLSGATLKGIRGLADANLRNVHGLGDAALAQAFGIAEHAVPRFVSQKQIWLESPKAVQHGAAAVCAGTPLKQAATQPTGTLPVVGGNTRGLYYHAPDGTEPVARRHIYNVACISSGQTVIETCAYDLGPVDRIQRTATVTVKSARTAKTIGSTTFTGGYPRTCPATLFFAVGDPHVVAGSDVPRNQVGDWLSQWR